MCLLNDLVAELFKAMNFEQEGGIAIYCDNNSAIRLSKDLVLHGRSKHLDVKFHFIR